MGQETRGRGAAVKWLRDRFGYEGDDCLTWPFAKNEYGYGQFGFNGAQLKAHRFMCELVNGPAPSPKHEAAHSCGKGHEGCVHPKHLSWKTREGNWEDRRSHGNAGKGGAQRYTLTPTQVEEIRTLFATHSDTQIATMYGVTRPNIHQIRTGKTWGPNSRLMKTLTNEQVIEIRALRKTMLVKDIAQRFGVSVSAVRRALSGQYYKSITIAA